MSIKTVADTENRKFADFTADHVLVARKRIRFGVGRLRSHSHGGSSSPDALPGRKIYRPAVGPQSRERAAAVQRGVQPLALATRHAGAYAAPAVRRPRRSTGHRETRR